MRAGKEVRADMKVKLHTKPYSLDYLILMSVGIQKTGQMLIMMT